MTTLGLLLAAGAGRRMGTPKALLRDGTGITFVVRAVEVLRNGGCDEVSVVVGASAHEVSALLGDADVHMVHAHVHAHHWDEGMGASLRAGLGDALAGDATCALVSLVDLPDVDERVVRRMLKSRPPDPRAALARAAYDGDPGHPVLIGRDHWAGVIASATGDRGARDYLAEPEHRPVLVECGDLASGRDVDTPESL